MACINKTVAGCVWFVNLSRLEAETKSPSQSNLLSNKPVATLQLHRVEREATQRILPKRNCSIADTAAEKFMTYQAC